MALKPITMLAALGAVYFISKQSKASPTTTKQDKPTTKEVELDLPQVDDKDEDEDVPTKDPIPNLPNIDDEKIPQPKGDQEGQIVIKWNMGDFFGQFLVNEKEQPSNPTIKDLWISKTCKSWGIGKEFGGLLPAKYVFENAAEPEKLISPIEWWATKGDWSPAPHYIADLPNDVGYRMWARNLIQYYSGGQCGYDIPQRKDFKTFKEFDAKLKLFEQTPIGKLYRELYRKVGGAMYINWSKQYPYATIQEDLRYAALWAIRNFPKLSTDKQTNEGYKKVFSEDPNAPKKIDPNNPAHEEYKDAWISINQWLKGYKKQIAAYGDSKDPLE